MAWCGVSHARGPRPRTPWAQSSSANSALNDPLFGDHRVQSHIVSRGGKAFDLLKRVGETDQTWRMPHAAPAAEGKRAVVVTATHAQAYTACIEPHERQEHDIEPLCTDRV